MKNGHFEVTVENDLINAKRHFEFGSGTIDIDVHFKPVGGATAMTLKQVHEASLNLSIQYLTELLERSKKA